MFIESISLKNYRNLTTMNVLLSEKLNIFYGNNAQGKTNFLEAIYLCATGRSHRSHNDRELIHFDENESYIQIFINEEQLKDKISIHLKKESKKGIALNGIPIKKIGDLFGILLVVIFSPEDLALVKNGPAQRRKFMDMEICQLSQIYYYELSSYYRVLKQRNKLLKSIQKHQNLIDTIDVWDQQLLSHGLKIMDLRREFLRDINETSSKIYADITDHKEFLSIEYLPNVSNEDYLLKLKKNLDRDIFLGTTSSGIHKDDIGMSIDHVDVRYFGSQGQQRSVALSIKLAEIELMKKEKNKVPVLLLDDVLSELDENRQLFLLSHLQGVQTIITCTGIEDVLKKLSDFAEAKLFIVNEGYIESC